MTYQEFKKTVEDTGEYYVTEDEQSVFVTKTNRSQWSIRISKNVEAFIEFNISTYGKTDGDLIRAALKLAETPLDERVPEKRYCLRHKFLVSTLNVLGTYLIDRNNVYSLGLLDYYPDHQTQFTKKKIEEIKNKYDVTLEDFEMIEVED